MGYEVKDVNPKEKMWLVRSSSRLIGPYSLEEIVELLTYNQVSFVDEIRRPKSRWNFIRDYPYLTETVKNNRDKLNLNNTKTSPLSIITGSFTRTESVDSFQAKEAAKIDFDDIKDIEPLKEVPFSFNPKSKSSDSKQSAAVAKSYGLLNDQKVKEELEARQAKLKRNVIIGTTIAVVLFGGFKVYQRMQNSERIRQKVEKVAQLYNLKLYQKSFQIYKEIAGADIPKETLELIAPARITIGKEISDFRNQTMSAIDTTNPKKRSELYNLLGLSFQIEGDNLKAQESFKKSLIQDPINELANINWGIQNYKMNSKMVLSPSSKTTLSDYYKNYSNVRYENYENIGYFSFVRGLYLIDFRDLFKDDINLVKKDLFESRSKSAFLRTEIALVKIGLSSLDGSSNDSAYVDFIELIPRQSQNFAKNPALDWTLTEWSALDDLCERIYAKSQQLMPKLFRAFCSLESGQFDAVDKLLDEAHLLSVGSNHYELMQLHVAYAKGQKMLLESLLKKSDLSNFAATHYYRGQNCLANKKMDCAKESFTTLGEKFPEWSYLAALGLFQVDHAQYSRGIFDALKKEPLQTQLIEARAQLENPE
jgi:tetratricopeptide (TPR) repeat protein